MKNIKWIVFGILAIGIGLYPMVYLLADGPIGIRSSKSAELLASRIWNIGFYAHIIPGGIAMLVGWTQFSTRIRNRYVKIHRRMGLVYVIAAIVAGVAGFSIAWAATGGPVAKTGFGLLGILWTTTTIGAYLFIRKGRTDQHERWMIFSYSLCFAAVTLRLYMPFLIAWTGDFIPAYRIVAWLCWIPNLLFAWYYTQHKLG
jgi:uncharacterized membrane protein